MEFLRNFKRFSFSFYFTIGKNPANRINKLQTFYLMPRRKMYEFDHTKKGTCHSTECIEYTIFIGLRSKSIQWDS